MAKEQEKDQSISFKVERYKFILQEIHSLNENVHRYLTLYQTLATTIIGAGILVFVNWKGFGITPNTAKVGIQALIGMLVILSLFIIIQIIAGIFSWMDYRNEEVKLLDEVVRKGYRSPSKISNLWRWSETYFVLFILAIAVFISIYTETNIIPLIK
jgi:hypothetical protein